MKGQELKILFKEDMAFLTEEVALDFKQVHIYNTPVKFEAPAFWTIRVINYNERENSLFVEVLSYHVGEIKFPINQIELADILILIEKVTFKSIDTRGLLATLHSKDPVTIFPPKPETIYRREVSIEHQTKIEREPIIQIYNEPFSISIKNVTFISGGITFKKKIQQFNQPISFQILNEDIIEQYDAIKNYFASVLKTKKIEVIPTVTTTDGVITSINATSTEIEKINKALIEEVKFEIIKTIRRKEPVGDGQILTMEEYFETFADDDLRAIQLFKDDNDFFERLLERYETKHYKQLRYLSSKHKSDIQKLRFVQNPFSFVFLLGGINKFYIIWETLDTQEATYIWTVANDIQIVKQALAHTDKIISQIIRDGKNEYIKLNEENFNRVFHDYTDLQNGFKNWKEEVEKIIL